MCYPVCRMVHIIDPSLHKSSYENDLIPLFLFVFVLGFNVHIQSKLL